MDSEYSCFFDELMDFYSVVGDGGINELGFWKLVVDIGNDFEEIEWYEKLFFFIVRYELLMFSLLVC